MSASSKPPRPPLVEAILKAGRKPMTEDQHADAMEMLNEMITDFEESARKRRERAN